MHVLSYSVSLELFTGSLCTCLFCGDAVCSASGTRVSGIQYWKDACAERQKVNASHWLKVQFVTRVCCRAVTQGVLSLKWAESQAAVPAVSIKACMCSIARMLSGWEVVFCLQHLYLWCWRCICICSKQHCVFLYYLLKAGEEVWVKWIQLAQCPWSALGGIWESENVLSLFWARNCANCKRSQ